MNAGDIRKVTGIQLRVGGESSVVQVTASPSQILPTDSGARVAPLTTKDIGRIPIEGRNISELLKVLPGVTTVSNRTHGGTSMDFSKEAPTGSTVGVDLSPSGAPYRGGTSYLLDGANIIDPGCNCYAINLTFEPIANNATVSGIEVVDE